VRSELPEAVVRQGVLRVEESQEAESNISFPAARIIGRDVIENWMRFLESADKMIRQFVAPFLVAARLRRRKGAVQNFD
jgi:hypothetical protein